MSVAKVIEISAESENGFEDCLKLGLAEAARTVNNIKSAWVKDHEVIVNGDKIEKHRVHMDVTFVVNGSR